MQLIYLYIENVLSSEKVIGVRNHGRKCSINSSKSNVVLFFLPAQFVPNSFSFFNMSSWTTNLMCDATTRSCREGREPQEEVTFAFKEHDILLGRKLRFEKNLKLLGIFLRWASRPAEIIPVTKSDRIKDAHV